MIGLAEDEQTPLDKIWQEVSDQLMEHLLDWTSYYDYSNSSDSKVKQKKLRYVNKSVPMLVLMETNNNPVEILVYYFSAFVF